MSDTPDTDAELAELGFGFYSMAGLPADAVNVEFARTLERERDSYESALRRIYSIASDGDDVWSDIEAIVDISQKALGA